MEIKHPISRYYVQACLVIGLLLDAESTIRLGVGFFRSLGLPDGPDGSIAYGTAAALMAGWTALLGWAIPKPRERRAVILLTIVPVVIAIWASNLIAVLASGQGFSARWFILGGAPLLATAYIVAYVLAGKLPKE